jgi:radical SAM protein (TIGR01212 family)
MTKLYYKFSDYLKNKYGTKVYKLPVNLPVSCPNRDGNLGRGGCIFCGEEGAGFENLSCNLSVTRQLKINSEYIGKRYGSRKYIAYFQNYSNTYLPYEDFNKYIVEACIEGIVAIYISTRPDCINEFYLEFLERISEEKGIDIVLEIGLQTVNYHTLEKLNRGHGLAEFIDAIIRIKRHNLDTCAHYIVDLPMDNMEDVKEGARILSALGVNQVKCHSMYILERTKLGEMYKRGEVHPVSLEEYLERVISFLEYLDPDIVIQRLIGRAPAERSLFCNWGLSWWKVMDLIEEKMQKEMRFQGNRFNYLNGGRVSFE